MTLFTLLLLLLCSLIQCQTVDQDERNQECSICLNDQDTFEEFKELNCGHAFHNDCINQWLKIKNTCPYCRATVKEDCWIVVKTWIQLSSKSKKRMLPFKNSKKCCGINGVKCQNKRVTSIHWNSKRLMGRIPRKLKDLTFLKELDLSNNWIDFAIPMELGGLKFLEYLNLKNNDLSGQIPESLGYLRNLRQLKLQNNKLTGIIPTSFKYLAMLESLNLQKNTLEGNVDPIKYLQRLQELDLRNNRFQGLLPPSFNNIQKCQVRGNKWTLMNSKDKICDVNLPLFQMWARKAQFI